MVTLIHRKNLGSWHFCIYTSFIINLRVLPTSPHSRLHSGIDGAYPERGAILIATMIQDFSRLSRRLTAGLAEFILNTEYGFAHDYDLGLFKPSRKCLFEALASQVTVNKNLSLKTEIFGLCPGEDLNLHLLRDLLLRQACLPFHHPGKSVFCRQIIAYLSHFVYIRIILAIMEIVW